MTRLHILHININGLKGKLLKLRHLVRNRNPDIIVVNEARTPAHFKGNIPGYNQIQDTL